MSEELDEEKLYAMASRIKALLEEYLLENPAIAGPKMKEVQEIKKSIQQKGLLVTWRARGELHPERPGIGVEVTLWKPKENLSPELAKMYDDWLMRQNGINP